LQEHHPWGEKLQAALGGALGGIATNHTWPLCENCHGWISYYLLPLMELQDSNETSGIILVIQMVLVVAMYAIAAFTPQVAPTARRAILKRGRHAASTASSS
jgi:hypothetical protein